MNTHPMKLVTLVCEALARQPLQALLHEVIAQPAVAGQLLVRREKHFFPRYAMIAYESDVRVLRREKF